MSAKSIWVDLLLYPGHTLPTAAAPVLVAGGLALHDRVFAPVPVVLALLGSWLIHVAGVFTDNHELLRRHARIVEHPQLTRAIADRTLTFAQLRAAICACLLLAALTAPYFIRTGGTVAAVIGVVGAAASLGYAGGPFPYARLGLAEAVFFVMFGFVAVIGTYYAQAALMHGPGTAALIDAVPRSAWIAGLPAGALVTNVLIIDDMRDREFDAAKGWRTAAVRFGVRASRAEYLVLSAVAYLAPLWLWAGAGFDAWVLLPLVTLPWAYLIGRVVWTRDRPLDLAPITGRASLLSFTCALLLAIGLAASR